MSESEVGAIAAATRQNAGTLRKPRRLPPAHPPLDGLKAPAATVSAVAIVVSGSFNDDRRSHESAGRNQLFAGSRHGEEDCATSGGQEGDEGTSHIPSIS